MKAPAVQTQGATGNTFQESKIGKDGLNMKAQTGQARVRISQALGHGIGGRFFRVVALGALLVGAAALYGSMSRGEAGNQPASNDTSQESVAVAPLWSPDPDLAELYYDQLTEGLFGIPASSGETSQAFEAQGYWAQKDEAEEMLYAELAKSFIGIPASGSQSAAPVQAPAPEFRIDPEWERAIERSELIRDYQAMGIPWEYDAFGNVVELPGKAATDTPFANPETAYYLDPDWREGQAPEGNMVAPDDSAELDYDELSGNFFGITSSGSRTPGTPLSREQMAARVEAERLEDPDLDGMLFDMLMGPPAGEGALGGQVAVNAVYAEEWEYDQLRKHFLGIPLTAK